MKIERHVTAFFGNKFIRFQWRESENERNCFKGKLLKIVTESNYLIAAISNGQPGAIQVPRQVEDKVISADGRVIEHVPILPHQIFI